ncbi:MAG: 4Fe-4S dicluster domain-containing protein [Noviherbaspirillum sp.]
MGSYRQIPIKPAAAAALQAGGEGRRAAGVDRRAFLKIMAASAALAGSACRGPPQEKIVPYVRMPELAAQGRPVFYASAFIRRGLAQGVLLETNMGRPTKVEGNPGHPASLGATDVFAQASILQLWDPDRSQAVHRHDADGETLSTWGLFEGALQEARSAWDRDGGASLRILTGTVTSPTLAGQIDALLMRYPEARWHCHDPLHDDAGFESARLAFGMPVDMLLRTERAQVLVSFDADIFGDWPGSIPYARGFTHGRKSEVRQFSNRLYAIESTPGLTGAYADNRLALAPQDIERLAWRLAARLGVPGTGGGPALPAAPGGPAQQWERALAARLPASKGRSLLVAGGSLSPQTRALVHGINAHLGNIGATVTPIAPVEALPLNHGGSIAALARDMHGGAVKALVIIGANPVYDAPAELDFAGALAKVPFSAHLGLYRDETGRRAGWHLPQACDYEQWSDGRAFDGSASIIQPAIMPLYGGRSAHELVALLARDTERNPYALVRRYWRSQRAGDFDAFWERALRAGVIERSAAVPLRLPGPARPDLAPPAALQDSGLHAIFLSDASVGAGEFSNNAWLQELPRPFTRLTWDNAAFISPGTAGQLALQTGDLVRLQSAGAPDLAVVAPVWVLPGQANGTVALPLGYGRTAAGSVGNGVGFNAFLLKPAAPGANRLELRKTGGRHEFAATQSHADMEGRDIVRMASLEEFRRNPRFATDAPRKRPPEVSLYPEWKYEEYKWGMAIDLNACIGCNACTIACQAENNIPTVGKEQVIRGREMHWIRVDRYEAGAASAVRQPRTVFQPVPCMHCERAPCEEVCPVGATVHDSEGLNVQVYNRCVGTRFCSNNCPYKVRRFNFLQFSNTRTESLKAAQNPEVTVRQRGVMEKCTYCLQRITRARIDAEKRGRKLRDGEVVTACQAVCPTEAIVFGDLNDPASRVNRIKASPLDYSLLAELNTRPRTTYAARVNNPDPELE